MLSLTTTFSIDEKGYEPPVGKNLGLESISLKNEAICAHKTKSKRRLGSLRSNRGFVGCSFPLHFSSLIASMPFPYLAKTLLLIWHRGLQYCAR